MLTQERFMKLPAWSKGYIVAIVNPAWAHGLDLDEEERDRYFRGYEAGIEDMMPTASEIANAATPRAGQEIMVLPNGMHYMQRAPEAGADVPEIVGWHMGVDLASSADESRSAFLVIDCKVGLTVRPAYRNDPLYQLEGEVLREDRPSLTIKFQNGRVERRMLSEVTFGHGKG